MKFILLMLNLFLLAELAGAQEINFSRVQDMAIWYNQSLKTDKNNSLKLNYRNVSYDGMMAYKSISAMVDVPLLSADSKAEERSGYFSVSAGAASDKSNQGILNNTMGMAGISYAIPIAGNETYMGFGVQGSYYQSKLNVSDGGLFADQYDQYGPIEGGQSSDRIAGGWSYNHFSVNAGLSVFSNSENNKWYMGASLSQINQPYTDDNKTGDYRLKPGIGVQGGYKYITKENDDCAFNMSLNWQGKAFKHFFNISYFKSIKGINGGVGGGMGYRFDDALVPNIELRYSKFIVGLSYDVNVSSINAAGFKRNGVELAVKLDF